MMKTLLAALVVVLGAGAADLNDAQRARIDVLEHSFMAPCCWSETLATHNSEIAFQLRKEIVALVAQGKTDREIRDLFKARYGARILSEPEGTTRVWLDVIPWLAIVIGGAAVLHVIRKWRMPRPTAT